MVLRNPHGDCQDGTLGAEERRPTLEATKRPMMALTSLDSAPSSSNQVDAVNECNNGSHDPRSVPTNPPANTQYTLPNDSIEQDRLEDQAVALAELMHNNPVHAPLNEPRRLVDVGCGTGIVTCGLGSTYPNAQIYGLDINPVPSRSQPQNVLFILGDARELLLRDERLSAGSLDFVFSRLLILGMTDWQGYMGKIVSALRRGGWVEIQEHAMEWYLNGKHCSSGWSWVTAMEKAAERKGQDLRCGKNAKDYMERAGLVDVQVTEYRLPVGTWAAHDRPETEHIGVHSANENGMLHYLAIPRMLDGMGYSESEMEHFREQILVDLAPKQGKERAFYVTIGRKP